MCTSLWGPSSHVSSENNCISDQENEGTEAGETWVSCKSFPVPLSAPHGFMVAATALLQQVTQPHKDAASHYAQPHSATAQNVGLGLTLRTHVCGATPEKIFSPQSRILRFWEVHARWFLGFFCLVLCMCVSLRYCSESTENFMLLRRASAADTVRFSWQKWSVSWPLTVEIEIIPSPDTIKSSSTLVAWLFLQLP